KLKNIYFIEARSPGSHIFSFTALPRLGSILLGTILKQKGYNVKVFIEDIAPPEWDLFDDADMVCISSITPTANRAFQLAESFRKRGIPVAIGGPHSTFLPDEGLQYADYVVRGEGEETLVELIDHIEGNKPLNSIRGLSFINDKGETVHNPKRELLKDLSDSPIPDFDLVHQWNKSKVVPVATSRGCPFGCKFCSVIPMFGRKYRFKPVKRVLDEIRSAHGKKRHFFFIDDNFTANKQRTKELMRAMIDNNIRIEWSAQVRTDVAKDSELLRLMKKAGCFAVYIGFESINPETLSLYNKGQGLKDIEDAIRAVKSHSINIHGMFVLGSDTDDIETIKETAKFAKKLDIESIQFMVLTPLPGTPVFEDLKNSGRLIHTDWSKYDAHHAVFEPKLMTAFELHVETLKAMARFYSWRSFFRNIWQFDFFYAVVCLYGKRSVKKALSDTRKYLDNLKEQLTAEFDQKTEKLRQYLPRKKGRIKNIILNTETLETNESQFFTVFLRKLDKRVVVTRERFSVAKETVAIIPLVEHLKNRREKGMQLLGDFYEKHRGKMDSARVIDMESISLYKSCVNIGLLLNANTRKVRRAYEKALKSVGGKAFECNHILVMLERQGAASLH
ncbi:MAG: B12-binding domain-containing radical SAM protein, partial [Nitrospira sp.]|nr:B12-binding domain-containing radical SAM protein [Nitrospira sp.]